MNVMLAPRELPPREPGRPWFAGILIGVFVLLCVGALVAHVLEGSNLLQLILDHAARPRVVNANIVEQYTRFRTEKIEGGEVVTGFEYAKSTDAVPRSQYCYVLKNRDTGLGLRVTLAAKRPDATTPVYPRVASEVAEQLDLTREQVETLARERCRFDQWE